MGVRDHMSYRFLGIPYALQPVGDLRLAYPIQWYTNETSYVMNATTCKSCRRIQCLGVIYLLLMSS